MALSLTECLREARSIPCFSGEDEYSIINYLRDVANVLSLTSQENRPSIQNILANKLRGKALHTIEHLINPSFEIILTKLKEVFGIQSTYLSLRNKAMDIIPDNIEDLHNKLSEILNTMNRKYTLEGALDILYIPHNNEKLIFEVYLTFMPCHIKTLLIQNNIDTIQKAYSYFLQHDLWKDIILNKSRTGNNIRNNSMENKNSNNRSYSNNSFQRQNGYKNFQYGQNSLQSQHRGYTNNNNNYNGRQNFQSQNFRSNNIQNNNYRNNYNNRNYDRNYNANNRVNSNNIGNQNNQPYRNYQFENNRNHNYYNNPERNNQPNNQNYNNHNWGRNHNQNFNNQNANVRQNPSQVVPMEVDNIQTLENFRPTQINPNYP